MTLGLLWYARKQFPTIKTNDDKSRVVSEVARLLALIDDPTKTSIYIDSLTEFHKGKTFWRQAIDNERKKAEEEAAKSAKQKETDIHKQYGFWVDNCLAAEKRQAVFLWKKIFPQKTGKIFHVTFVTNVT